MLVIQPDARHAHQTPSRGIYESIKSDFMKMAHPIIASAPRPKSLAVKIARRRNFLDLFSQKFLFFLLGYAKSELNTAGKIDRGLGLKADANYKSPGIHRAINASRPKKILNCKKFFSSSYHESLSSLHCCAPLVDFYPKAVGCCCMTYTLYTVTSDEKEM